MLTGVAGRDRDKGKALTPRSRPHGQCHRSAGRRAPGAAGRSASPRYRSRCTPSPPDLEPRWPVSARRAPRVSNAQTDKELKRAVRALTGGRTASNARLHGPLYFSNSK